MWLYLINLIDYYNLNNANQNLACSFPAEGHARTTTDIFRNPNLGTSNTIIGKYSIVRNDHVS